MLTLFDKLIKRHLISGIYPEGVEYRNKLRHFLSNSQEPVTVYSGYDATSNSLHVGNLATIISSLHMQASGHQVICVIGDATAQLGDPSGHSKDRKRLEKTVILDNANQIEITLKNLFKNFGENFICNTREGGARLKTLKPPIIVRNSQWYQDKDIIDFVDEIFRDVRVGTLLHKKSIQERLKTKEGMNMAEFSYQIFQAFDWLRLRQLYDCKLQIGGNDQQGNIYAGHDLIKKILGKTDSIGLLAPLITNAKGKKLGKSTESSKSSIWLNPKLTSPYELYQFFHRTPDKDVGNFLNVFTFYECDYIDELLKSNLKNKNDIWYCQRKLAEHACLLIHGQEGLNEAKRITDSLFVRKLNG